MHLRKIAAALLAAVTLLVPAGCAVDPSAIGDLIGPSASSGAQVTEWSLAAAPDYYTVTGKADFTGVTLPAAGEITYAQPDSLGRSGRAVGVITKQLRDDGSERDRDMPSTITGWPKRNPEVDINLTADNTCAQDKSTCPKNTCYHGYLFNKSHLIAKSLGGADKAENMVTGTRTQNVGKNNPAGGMAYTETEARDWIDKHPDGTITYMATPNYTGNELLPRTVTVDIRTSDGSIDQHVTVWNTANGYSIDYAKGGTLQ
ncbi:DNA/RNA non-specific endonuclease [Bifidobacterium sp. DSM 109958]|uniref:DNA/RNA non-specific endonuclease n=1 Tax=Bifidobacterium moraviense TaxID=2675323 RepID=A0A7Y0F0F4_9BIFI|nr:DNA/RNA non-specific endonuclease [Bifidobacterium sp. DSM 109958]NMM99698.1 DNA/RNA non-specific endonuclease [Bifidobacterium sp. DSM 109958]